MRLFGLASGQRAELAGMPHQAQRIGAETKRRDESRRGRQECLRQCARHGLVLTFDRRSTRLAVRPDAGGELAGSNKAQARRERVSPYPGRPRW